VTQSGAATEPVFTVEVGWTFMGWDTPFDNVTGDLTVTAQYEATTYAVDFDLGTHGTRTGGGELSQTVAYGTGAAEPVFDVDAGWTFAGWDTPFDNVTSDLTVTAQYTADTLVIELAAGWNQVSLNLHPEDPSCDTVFAGIMPVLEKVISVKRTIGGGSSYTPGWGDLNTLTELEDGCGYWVKVSAPATWTVNGVLLDPAVTPIKLGRGWNYIAFIGASVSTVDGALDGIMGVLEKVAGDGGNYTPGWGDLNTLKTMRPGVAYWVKVSSATTLTYGFGSPGTRSFRAAQRAVPDWSAVQPDPPAMPHMVMASVTLDGAPVSAGSKLGVFVGEECRAVGERIAYGGKSCFNLTVLMGSAGETATFRLHDVTGDTVQDTDFTMTLTPGASDGTPAEPVDVAFVSADDWKLDLAMGGALPATLTIGMRADATDGLDVGSDEQCPMPGSGQACLASDDLALSYSADYRALAETGEFLLLVSASDDEDATVTWHASTLPSGKCLSIYEVVLDTVSRDRSAVPQELVGNTGLNMALTSSLTVPAGDTRSYVIRYGDDLVFDLALEAGWNLVSLPIEPNDPALDIVLDDGETLRDGLRGTVYGGDVITWNGEEYTTVSELHACIGYWIYMPGEGQVVLVQGLPVWQTQLDLTRGWNQCGVEAAGATPDDARIVGTPWFWNALSRRYEATDVLRPGLGFWINASEDAQIPLSAR
jgi:hypothetical protein